MMAEITGIVRRHTDGHGGRVDPSVVGSQGRIHVSVAGIDMPVLQITAGLVPGTIQVMFQVTKSFNGYGAPLVVTVDASHTDPFSIVVR